MLPALAAELHNTFLKSSFTITLRKDLATNPQWFQPLDTTVIFHNVGTTVKPRAEEKSCQSQHVAK